ncbi:MAG: HAMP domain-containing histidine kinase [Anaerolineae bacterium]|nr:HAMP domain-containing histidine kinase [Anaerolineae bacterium]
MTDLARWLDSNSTVLVQAVVEKLSQNEAQKAQVIETVASFFESLIESVRHGDSAALNDRLSRWVEGRSAPTEGELTRLVPVLISIKQVNAEQIRLLCEPAQAVDLLIALDVVYDRAINYLSQLESDALLADMRDQLQQAQQQLERLDKSKSDFIAVAAHELRTPITLVEGYANMVLDARPDLKQDEGAMALFEGMTSGVKRLREIIRDMLDVSLITLDMIELHAQPTWLNQIIDAASHSVESPLRERRMKLRIEHETIPKRATYADPERLVQVLNKILMNAIKYTPDGGEVIVQARELTGFVDVMVIDNGIGISPNDLSHIFGMFSTVGDASLHSSGKSKFRGGGPGLGLYISKGIIEAHGGNIWAESAGYDELNLPGSTFHIMIPMRNAPQGDNLSAIIMKTDKEVT